MTEPANGAAVRVEGLVHRYGALTAVDGLSFEVRPGEIFGLLGPNGAGKTTTLSVLSCLLTPAAGRVYVAGYDVVRQSPRVKPLMGLVPQDVAVYPELSGRDNLRFFGRIYGLRGSHLNKRIDAVLEIVGLRNHAGRPVGQYSGGMKRRLNLAAGLLHEPQILFLDEPTVGVDPQSRNHIFENVEALSAAGVTVLYTTHYMEEAERLCHRVAIMDRGRLVALGTPRELIESLGGGVIVLGVESAHTDAARDILSALPGVTAVESAPDGTLHLTTTSAQHALVDVMQALNARAIPVTRARILEPNLETVFLRHTGRNLRD